MLADVGRKPGRHVGRRQLQYLAVQVELDEVRLALQLKPSVPIVMCDARKRDSSREVLIALVKHSARLRAEPVGS